MAATTEPSRKKQRTFSSTAAAASEAIASAASTAAAAIKGATTSKSDESSPESVISKPEKTESKDYPGSHPTTTTATTTSEQTSNPTPNAATESAESEQPKENSEILSNNSAKSDETTENSGLVKPATGSEEWHNQRRFNHKEVERRRRKNISDGINELQELLPTPDANKAQIIRRAVEYIKRLKETETNNIEKWTLEKLISDQAVNELSNSNDKLKIELEKAYIEIEHWKKNYNALIKQQNKDE